MSLKRIKIMKIAHINNTAGIAATISACQVLLGNESDVYVFNQLIHRQFGGTRLNYWWPIDRWRFFRMIKGYDVWHYHYPFGSLKKALEKRKSDRAYVKHYHGNDLRGLLDNDVCLVSTPDLLKYAPNGIWSPSPINLRDIDQLILEGEKEPNKITKIAHYPFYENYQGHDYYSHALSTLQSENLCKVVNILRRPHTETLKALANCDLVIGKILPEVGWFGKFELEGMALGKPVITFVSDELYDAYKPPVYRTDKFNFEKDLKELIDNKAERRRLSIEGRRYIEKNHNVVNICRSIEQVYEEFT
jgi:Glycosyl transferases group 1